jgi:hypothetical protein
VAAVAATLRGEHAERHGEKRDQKRERSEQPALAATATHAREPMRRTRCHHARPREYAPPMDDGGARTWVLTGSLENYRATAERGFRVIGMKERRRRMAEQIVPGDTIIFYVTGVQAFGGSVRVAGEMYEDRTRIWPGKPGDPDSYPWRFETEPAIVLGEDELIPAEAFAQELEHVRKWPPEHWHLAFQGQLRTISYRDAALLERVLHDAAHYPKA